MGLEAVVQLCNFTPVQELRPLDVHMKHTASMSPCSPPSNTVFPYLKPLLCLW